MPNDDVGYAPEQFQRDVTSIYRAVESPIAEKLQNAEPIVLIVNLQHLPYLRHETQHSAFGSALAESGCEYLLNSP